MNSTCTTCRFFIKQILLIFNIKVFICYNTVKINKTQIHNFILLSMCLYKYIITKDI